MRSEASETATGSSEETAPESKGVVEQKKPSLQDVLIAEAKAEGQISDDKPVDAGSTADSEPGVEGSDEPELPLQETPETPAEGEDAPAPEEEEEPAADKAPPDKKLVPLAEVLEEREKKKRANDRADRVESELQKAQGRIEELERSLSQSSGPMPNENNPVIDIQDPLVLDKYERVYEAMKEVDLDALDEDGNVTMPTAIGTDGQFVYRKLAPDQARLAQIRADRAVRKFIPKRRFYLDERAKVDASATTWYPDLQNTEHEFTKTVNRITNDVLSGRVSEDPNVKFWVANAVYGFLKRKEETEGVNGNGKPKESEVKKIVEASKVKVAPTAPRGGSLPPKRSPSADLAKANQRLKENPDDEEAQLAYIEAARSQRGQKSLPMAE